ncbi:MAG: hypothetical protein JWO15_982 [Sphingomonadales bacterium]|nr:hypothetical protein [Sphingomonadales bacterium]
MDTNAPSDSPTEHQEGPAFYRQTDTLTEASPI